LWLTPQLNSTQQASMDAGETPQWVTLYFAKAKVLNSSFKPNIGLKPN